MNWYLTPTGQWDESKLEAKLKVLRESKGAEEAHVEYDELMWGIARLARPDLVAKVDEALKATGENTEDFWYS